MDEKGTCILLMSPASSTNPFLLVLFLWYLLHFLSVSFLGSCCSSNLFVQCTPDKWTTLVPSNIGPFIQLVNISDLTYVTGFAKTGLIAGVRNYSYSPFSSAK